MGLTILFGDRERKSTVDEIAKRAREVVDGVLGLHRRNDLGDAAIARPVWHSVAMQIECRETAEYARLLSAIERNCAQRKVAVMGVRVV